jgi:hypothetical protein
MSSAAQDRSASPDARGCAAPEGGSASAGAAPPSSSAATTARRKPRSEFEAMIEQGWTLIDPGGGVWRKQPKPDFESCGNCGRNAAECCSFDPALGCLCSKCGASDADE